MMGAFTVGLAVHGAATYAAGAAIDHGRGRLGADRRHWPPAGCIGLVAVTAPGCSTPCWALLGAAMAMTLYEPAFNIPTKRYPALPRGHHHALTLVGGFASTLSFPAMAALIAGLDWRPALAVIGAG